MNKNKIRKTRALAHAQDMFDGRWDRMLVKQPGGTLMIVNPFPAPKKRRVWPRRDL